MNTTTNDNNNTIVLKGISFANCDKILTSTNNMFSDGVIAYGRIDNISYELSEARMFNDVIKYGVTTSINNKIQHELNDLFESKLEAIKYINNKFTKEV